jgi:hypothetical protein
VVSKVVTTLRRADNDLISLGQKPMFSVETLALTSVVLLLILESEPTGEPISA